MAIMYFKVKSVSRGRGSSAVSRAAYTARERLYDQRKHQSFDFRERSGLEHAEIMLPSNAPAENTEWARDRESLWNGAEATERRKNARVAREYVVALPHELGSQERLQLARGFAQSIADRYGVIVDVAVHRATEAADARNYHAHILSTTRELTATGLGRKTDIELRDGDRRDKGLPGVAEEIRQLRHRWADLINDKLHEAQLKVRVDARSLWEQGSSRLPQPILSPGIIAMERSGGRSDAAERLRQEHAARQQLMLKYSSAHEAATAVSSPAAGAAPEAPRGGADASIEGRHLPQTAHGVAHSTNIGERQRLAAERWLAYRRGLDQGKESPHRLERGHNHDGGAELDY